ncbi:MAG: hypothetical protein R2932_47395 [Caldilineaceae bacterium]
MEDCKKKLAAMVQRTTEQGATVLLRRPFWSDAVDQAVLEVNAYWETLVGEQVLLFNTAALLASANGTIRPEYSSDLLHLRV